MERMRKMTEDAKVKVKVQVFGTSLPMSGCG
jgi:hypothetical protein